MEAVARLFGEWAASADIGASPAFAAEKLPETARRFLDLVVLPMLVRALFGEDLSALRAEMGAHAARVVGFFLAACRHTPPASGRDEPLAASEGADR